MGVSTDGQICYGVVFPEGQEFPWDESDDEEAWWRGVTGYVPMPGVYDAKGEYVKPAPSRAMIDEYHDRQHSWDKAHPLPFEPVNYCSGEYPQWILAVKSSCVSCSRGYPKKITPSELVVSQADVDELLAFIEKYIPDGDGSEAAWWLSIYWG